jgi:hypothetical protein
MMASSVTLDAIAGVEYFWLATDGVGNVAMFSTAGGGFAPDLFLANVDAHDDAIERIRRLVPSTRPRKAPLPDTGDNVWRELAERGLFTFDSDVFGGPYVLESAPVDSVNILALPPDVAQVAASIQYRNLDFGNVVSIDKALLLEPVRMEMSGV